MGAHSKTISEFKSQLRVAMGNLKKLEDIRSGVLDSVQENNIQHLMVETKALLNQLETTQASKISKIIEKRKRKRRSAKIRHKIIKQQIKLTKETVAKTLTSTSDVIEKARVQTRNTTISTKAESPKSHQQLRSYRDSNRFLRTFELLDLLHKTRVQDEESRREFSEKLRKLRSIWNVIRLENVPERTNDVRNQWSTILFGVPEKSYYKRERNFNDLICVRRKWDSYITQKSSVGSSIPLGWVLPRENTDPRWASYRIQ